MKSIWNMRTKEYEQLTKDLKTQVAVVGGGIAGYLTAFKLSKLGYEVSLFEANRILSGTTLNTTAYITALQGVFYQDLIKKYGREKAKLYFESQIEGINEYKKLVQEYNIDCDFTKLPTYLFTRGNNKKLIGEFDALNKIGARANYVTKLEEINLKINGAIKLDKQAMFHLIKFLTSLPVSFKIFEHSRVIKTDFKNKTLYTDKSKIKAEHIIIATHFPIFDCPKMLYTKMYQSMSYCQAYLNAPKLNALYVEDVEDGITLRSYKNYLIIGGADHRTGRFKSNSHFNRLNKEASKIFKELKPQFSWLAQDCMTFDYMPFVGKIDKNLKDCYTITGFNKWGMANSIISAQIIADFITKKPNAYAELFSLNRNTILKNKKSFAAHMFETTKNLAKSFLHLPLADYNELKPGEGGTFIIGAKKYGVYKDEEGKIHKVKSRCSHLKCQLVFNKEAGTFDCPCHGSRFDTEGKILYAPAQKDIKVND
jgi:glycine/D-amino acid oxidase-like deaminating enzyme/nitrite reductase/ring-hydroxylating ferredoxin subunit